MSTTTATSTRPLQDAAASSDRTASPDVLRHHAAKVRRATATNAAKKTGRRSRQPVRRRLIPIALGLVGTIAMLLGPLASQSQAATILPAVPLDRCYAYNTSGKALMQVDPPSMESMQSTVPVYVGADNQTVRYQPYLQRYNGSAWVTIANGPLFTGLANQWYPTTWYGSTDGVTQWVVSRASSTQYYRVLATLWWVADQTHAGYTYSGVVEHQQYTSSAGWRQVSYCTY